MKKVIYSIAILLCAGNLWAADTKVSDLTADTTPSTDDLVVTVNDPAGTPANRKVTIANLQANVFQPLDSNLTYLAGVTLSDNVKTLLGSANYAAMTGLPYVVTESDPGALLSAGTDNVKDTHIDWGSGAGQIGYADIVALWTTCSGLLYSDGTCVSLASFTEIDPVVGAISGIVKANGTGTISAATGGTDYLRPTTDVDDTPVNSETAQPVSSNWAYDHAAKAPHLLWQSANINPDSLYTNEAGIFELAPKTPAALTVTEIFVALNEDPTTELTVTCYHKTAAIGYTGGTQIDTNDTVAGTFSATSTFDDATIPAGSKVWCVVVDNPDATTTHLGISLFGTWD